MNLTQKLKSYETKMHELTAKLVDTFAMIHLRQHQDIPTSVFHRRLMPPET